MRTVKLRFKRTQQLPTLLNATCCVPMHTLLRVVGSCNISLHTTANTDAATPIPTLLTQQCWELLLRPFARSFTDQLRRECIWTSVFCCCCRCFVLFFCLFVFVFCFLFSSFQHFAVLYKFYFCHLKLSGKTNCKIIWEN